MERDEKLYHKIRASRASTIKLRRALTGHGGGEWEGEWSDSSCLWTPSLREEVGHKDEDDGATPPPTPRRAAAPRAWRYAAQSARQQPN